MNTPFLNTKINLIKTHSGTNIRKYAFLHIKTMLIVLTVLFIVSALSELSHLFAGYTESHVYSTANFNGGKGQSAVSAFLMFAGSVLC